MTELERGADRAYPMNNKTLAFRSLLVAKLDYLNRRIDAQTFATIENRILDRYPQLRPARRKS